MLIIMIVTGPFSDIIFQSIAMKIAFLAPCAFIASRSALRISVCRRFANFPAITNTAFDSSTCSSVYHAVQQ